MTITLTNEQVANLYEMAHLCAMLCVKEGTKLGEEFHAKVMEFEELTAEQVHGTAWSREYKALFDWLMVAEVPEPVE